MRTVYLEGILMDNNEFISDAIGRGIFLQKDKIDSYIFLRDIDTESDCFAMGYVPSKTKMITPIFE